MEYVCSVCGTISPLPRCPEHRRKPYSPHPSRSGPWGSTWAWRKLRAQVLERDGYRCRYCGDPATHADHVVPVSMGGAHLDPANVVAACAPCNRRKGSRPALKPGQSPMGERASSDARGQFSLARRRPRGRGRRGWREAQVEDVLDPRNRPQFLAPPCGVGVTI